MADKTKTRIIMKKCDIMEKYGDWSLKKLISEVYISEEDIILLKKKYSSKKQSSLIRISLKPFRSFLWFCLEYRKVECSVCVPYKGYICCKQTMPTLKLYKYFLEKQGKEFSLEVFFYIIYVYYQSQDKKYDELLKRACYIKEEIYHKKVQKKILYKKEPVCCIC